MTDFHVTDDELRHWSADQLVQAGVIHPAVARRAAQEMAADQKSVYRWARARGAIQLVPLDYGRLVTAALQEAAKTGRPAVACAMQMSGGYADPRRIQNEIDSRAGWLLD